MKMMVANIVLILLVAACAKSKLSSNEFQNCHSLAQNYPSLDKFSPASRLENSQTLIGVRRANSSRIEFVVSYDPRLNELSLIDMSYLSNLTGLYEANSGMLHELSSHVRYDGVESDRCEWAHEVIGESSPTPQVLTSSPNSGVNGEILPPSAAQNELFERLANDLGINCVANEETCRKADLDFITDLDRDGKFEFWYHYSLYYRVWYGSREYDAITRTWREIFRY